MPKIQKTDYFQNSLSTGDRRAAAVRRSIGLTRPRSTSKIKLLSAIHRCRSTGLATAAEQTGIDLLKSIVN
ncbi:hypothetical protein QT971_15195 [Microcoleus sp. herbarium19]|uniref:hypothetical protein n=1 Tax=unclassified Microcoleus TaxID=2642155 RepID=UPI002FD1BD77